MNTHGQAGMHARTHCPVCVPLECDHRPGRSKSKAQGQPAGHTMPTGHGKNGSSTLGTKKTIIKKKNDQGGLENPAGTRRVQFKTLRGALGKQATKKAQEKPQKGSFLVASWAKCAVFHNFCLRIKVKT